tara:strand:+ start:658 stop:867 length:210 start_codon:yes stop_codon:yes gene_type:complete
MVDYSKWDKMVKDLETMDSEEVAKHVKCEIGKPLTEEEFNKIRKTDTTNIVKLQDSGNITPISTNTHKS